MDEILVNRKDNGVVTISFNRPQRKNAIIYSMWEEMRQLFHEISQNEDDRVVIFTGEGDAFCAGADLGKELSRLHPLRSMDSVNSAVLALHEITRPTIAKVNGDAVGAGMNIALGCDLVVAGESARFSQIFVHRGLSVDFGGTWLLPRAVGMHKAKELAMLGEILSAREAEQMGLVNRVVADNELDDFVDDWADRLAAGPPLALQMTKKMLSNAFNQGLPDALDAEATSQSINLASEDTREGVLAFIEKRDPVFKGR